MPLPPADGLGLSEQEVQTLLSSADEKKFNALKRSAEREILQVREPLPRSPRMEKPH